MGPWDQPSPRIAARLGMLDSARSTVQSQPGSARSTTAGLDESQMIQEARYRIAYNKQRSQLRNLLSCVQDEKGTVSKDQLQLAANLAGFELPQNVSQQLKSPRRLYVKPIVSSLELPPLQGFAPTPRPTLSKRNGESSRSAVAYVPPSGYKLEVIDPQVKEGWQLLKDKCETNFGMLKQAFRRMDYDKSGKLNSFEVHKVIHEFNAGLSHKVIDQLISIADQDGDGEIDWLEFIKFLKQGVPDEAGEMLAKQADARAAARARAQEESRKNEIRTCQKLIANRIETNFGSTGLRTAFRQIDDDKSGTLDMARATPNPAWPQPTFTAACVIAVPRKPATDLQRHSRAVAVSRLVAQEELRRLLFTANLVPEMVSPANLDIIINMADFDGDGKINYAEFARMITAGDITNLKGTLTAADGNTTYA